MKLGKLNNEIEALLSDMVDATQRAVTTNWVAMKPFVELESRHLLESIANIARLKASGMIDEEQAALQLAIQKETYLSLLLTVRGIRKVQAENALNAGLSVIRSAVNTILGWSLL